MPRRIGLVAGAVAVLVLLAGCVDARDRADTRPSHLPLGVPVTIVVACEHSVGLEGSSEVGTKLWRDSQGMHAKIGLGSQYAVGSGLSTTQSALISCLTVAAGPDRYPDDSASLLLLWRYSSSVLWPCLAHHGVDAGPAPSREAFLSRDPLRFDPFDRLPGTLNAQASARLRRDCPPVPGYLQEKAG